MEGAHSQRSFRTRLINVFRSLLKFRAAELFLASLTQGKSRRSLAWKFVPPEYLYKKSRNHRVIRAKIVFDLDLSNYNEFCLFYGLPEPSLNYLFSFIRPDFTILDIGANVGFTTLNFAARCKEGYVYAYEPDSLNFSKLERNVSLNPFFNISMRRKGLGEFAVTPQLMRLNKHHSGMNRIQSEATEGLESEKIEVVRLDDEVAVMNPNDVDLIKIDVEGYELDVVRGALETIRKFKPILFIELIEGNLRQYGQSSETLFKLVRGLGYRVFDAKSRKILEDGSWDHMETDILCLPAV